MQTSISAENAFFGITKRAVPGEQSGIKFFKNIFEVWKYVEISVQNIKFFKNGGGTYLDDFTWTDPYLSMALQPLSTLVAFSVS
jgi:hypothetical protein